MAGWLRHRIQDIDLLGGGNLDAQQIHALVEDLRFRTEGVRLFGKGDPANFEKFANELEEYLHETGGLAFIRSGLTPRKRSLVLAEEWTRGPESVWAGTYK